MNYYINRWENIAGTHYMLHDTHMGKFSTIFNDKHYIIKKDHKPIFFNLTGISYQVVELIHELIKIKLYPKYMGLGYKEWLKHDDELYSILSKKIMSKMTKTKSLLI